MMMAVSLSHGVSKVYYVYKHVIVLAKDELCLLSSFESISSEKCTHHVSEHVL